MNIARQLGSVILYKKAAAKAEAVHGILAFFLSVAPPPRPYVTSLGDIENIWAHHTMNALNSEACAIFLVDRNAPQYLILAGHTTNKVKEQIGQRFNQLGQGLTGRVAQTRMPIRLNRVESEKELVERYGPEGSSWKSILEDLPDSASEGKPYIAVPIIYGERLLGVIRCYGKQQLEHFSQDDEDLLKAISDALALSIMHLWNVEAIIGRDEWQSSFMRQASHQLRGPISDLAHTIELYRTELRNIGGKNSALAVAIDRIPRLQKLIRGLLDYAYVEGKLGRLRRGLTSISSIVNEEVRDLQVISAERNIQISVHDFAENFEVYGDSELLRQCLNNILSNAIRFSPEGKKITVSITKAGAIEGPEGYIVDTVDDTSEVPDSVFAVVISVTDEGPGVPKERQSEIFEEFVSIGAGNVSASTGFGLPISRKIARSYGGNTKVVSPVANGRGSTFKILFPLANK